MPEDKPIIKVDIAPLADVANHLLDKVENACCWFSSSTKSKRQDRDTADQLFIERIKGNANLSPLEQAALICNSRKIIKEYTNQNDILQLAIKQLDETAKPDDVDEDWLSHFFDQARFVSKTDVQVIWAKLLSNECEHPGSIPKSLIRRLSDLSTQDAKAFESLCDFVVNVSTEVNLCFTDPHGETQTIVADGPEDVYPIIDLSCSSEYFVKHGLTFYMLKELESQGLISFDSFSGVSLTFSTAIFSYHGKKVRVISNSNDPNRKGKIHIGGVLLTQDGKGLFQAIQHTEQPDFMEVCKAMWTKNMLTVTSIS